MKHRRPLAAAAGVVAVALALSACRGVDDEVVEASTPEATAPEPELTGDFFVDVMGYRPASDFAPTDEHGANAGPCVCASFRCEHNTEAGPGSVHETCVVPSASGVHGCVQVADVSGRPEARIRWTGYGFTFEHSWWSGPCTHCIEWVGDCGDGAVGATPGDETAPDLAPGEALPIGDDGIPEFTGPWAFAFEDNWIHAESDFVRAILADGVVNRAEAQESLQRVAECTINAGSIFTWYPPDDGISGGAWGNNSNDWVAIDHHDEVWRACMRRYDGSGWDRMGQWDGRLGVSGLFQRTHEDPDATFSEANFVSCFQRHGLAGPGFTWEQAREVMWGGCGFSIGTLAEERLNPCWSSIIEVGDRDRRDIALPDGRSMWTEIDGQEVIFLFNPQYVEEPRFWPGGQPADDPQVSACFENPLGLAIAERTQK